VYNLLIGIVNNQTQNLIFSLYIVIDNIVFIIICYNLYALAQ